MKIILSAAFVIFLFTGCSDDKQQASDAPAHVADTVKAFLLRNSSIEKKAVLPGELLPYEVVEIHPKVAGYIREVKVDIGSQVKRGQILAVVDAPEIESRLAESASRMQAAKAKYEASKDTYDRIITASQSDGVIAPNELQRAKNQMLSDSSDFIAAEYASRSSRQVGNYLVILAPFSGTITERNVHPGSYVGGVNEKPALVIQDNAKLRLRVAVPEALNSVSLKNNKVQFVTRSNPNQKFEGRLSRKSGSIDASTRTEIWEFEINNDHAALKPGAFAEVSLDVSRSQPSFVVPVTAIATTLEKKFVIRLRNSKAEWIDVQQGLNQSDSAEIFGNLQPGDTLASKATEELRAATSVVVRLPKQ